MTKNWSISELNEETGMDRRTIKKVLGETAPCDVDGKTEFYKLADFIHALTKRSDESQTALEEARTRLANTQADIAEVDRARLRNEVLEVETVFRVWENIAISIRRTVLTSALGDLEKDAILHELENLKVQDFMEQREFDKGTAAEISADIPAA